MDRRTRFIRVLLAVFPLVIAVPAWAQGAVLADFGTVAEAFTSPNRGTGIEAGYRLFSLPTFDKTCRGSGRPSRLVSPNGTVTLHAGEWFPLRSLIIVAVDAKGGVLRPLPISLEVERTSRSLLNLDPEMISDTRLLPVRAGRFRIRARTICPGTFADTYIQAAIR